MDAGHVEKRFEKVTPEEIKRGGTGSRTNKAFDRYFQPQRQEKLKVKNAITVLKETARGEVKELKIKK